MKKIKPGETPRIYFTHTLWLPLQGSIFHKYVDAREDLGRTKAEGDKACGGCLGQFMDKERCDALYELYCTGHSAYSCYGGTDHRHDSYYCPENLKRKGDEAEAKGFGSVKLPADPGGRATDRLAGHVTTGQAEVTTP